MKRLLVLFTLPAVVCLAEPEFDAPVCYAEIGGGGDPDALWASAGVEGCVSDFCSMYAGLFLAGAEDIADKSNDFFSGLVLGVRLSLPCRISPYVGGGVTAGWGRYYERADEDGRDNDDDDLIDESGEEKKSYEMINSVFPEAGIHFWLSDTSRVTLNGRYHFTTEGDDHDYWTANVGILVPY